MTDIVDRPVHEISGLAVGGAGYSYTGQAYDFAVGGIPLLSASSGDSPYVRRTGQFRKEQTDDSEEPGEQSLSYWWMRSQSSFHSGAGQEFLDGFESSDVRRTRFSESLGVDVWTPGRVTLLRAMQQLFATHQINYVVGGASSDQIVFATSTDLVRATLSTGATSVTAVAGISAMTSDGVNVYYATATGIYKRPLDFSAGATQLYTSPLARLAFIKARLMGAGGNSIYELSTSAAAAALPAAHYTSPVEQVFEHFAEGPAGILVAARIGTQKAQVLNIGINATTAALEAPVVVASLPDGETISMLYSYLNTYLALGTNKGLRIGLVAGSQVTYGPLTFEVAGTNVVRGAVGQGSFLYVGVDDLDLTQTGTRLGPGVVRVDLGTETSSGRYAYARDQRTKNTTVGLVVTGVLVAGSRLVVTANGATVGAYATSTTAYEASGTLTSSKIRFSTSEKKLFRYLRLSATGGGAVIGGSLIGANGTVTGGLSVNTGSGQEVGEDVIRVAPAEFVSVRLDITNNDTTTTPVISSYQLKAMPAPRRQREFAVPVLLYDFEKDRTGQRSGYSGWALWRLEQLEALEEAGDEVTFQHIVTEAEDTVGRAVVIDSIEFRQITPPNSTSGWGGVAVLNLRTLT